MERGDELSRQLNCTYVVVPQLISYVHVPIDIIHPLTSQFVVRTRKGLLRSATVQIGWMELLAPAAAGRERDNGGQLDKERCNGSSFVPYCSTTLLLTCLYDSDLLPYTRKKMVLHRALLSFFFLLRATMAKEDQD